MYGTPPLGELNARGVAKYTDFRPIEGYISEKVQDRRYITLSRFVPKSVTMNDERRNGPYFALFHRIRVQWRPKTIIRPISVSKPTFNSL